MRIISGIFRGKKLFLPDDKKTRPLKDIVKEAIFNLIQHSNKINIKVENSVVLDLFSGSGSFGVECLSRGAKYVYFIENYKKVLNSLKKNLSFFENKKSFEILEKDCFEYVNSNENLDTKFDIIFIDPPYKEIKINEIIDRIKEKKILKKSGIIILHRHKKDTVMITKRLNIIDNRTYGISKIFFGN